MQQYLLTKKKKEKKTGVTNRPQSRNFQAKHDSSSILPSPVSFSLSHSTFIPRFANWRVFSWPSSKRQLEIYFRTELVSHPLYRRELNAARQNRHSFRESYLNSLRYRNVDERGRKKKKRKKYERNLLFFFFRTLHKQLFNELLFSLSRILNVNAYYFISINKIMDMSKLEMACIY